MKVRSICKTYFNGFSIIKNEKKSTKQKILATGCIISYFFVLPPIIFGIGYALSSHYIWKPEKKVTPDPIPNQTTKKTQQTYDNEKKAQGGSKMIPEVTKEVKDGFFVDVLNKKGYLINGKSVQIPAAGKPEEFKLEHSFKDTLEVLKSKFNINDKAKIAFQFKDRSTEQAINESHASRIALNFANEHHAGGGPGFHKDKDTQLFAYDARSARAQEESLCQRSDLMASLTQLPHELRADSGTNFVRSYYTNEFDSKKMAYVSLNHLFALQTNQNFYNSHYLEEPKAVAFVTSAAKFYGNADVDDFSKNSDVYKDAIQRIETHLLAAASRAVTSKMEKPDQPVELILGAFGCGAFVPKKNPDEYREMIAKIYKELLPEFSGFFDVVTFAVPTFGDTNPSNAAVANHRVFKRVLEF